MTRFSSKRQRTSTLNSRALLHYLRVYAPCVFFSFIALFVASLLMVHRIVQDLDGVGAKNSDQKRKMLRVNELLHQSPQSRVTSYYDELGPNADSLIQERVRALRLKHPRETVDSLLSYDIHRCPDEIPDGYPQHWKIQDVLGHWNPDNVEIPSHIYQGVCELDWNDPVQRDIALKYRKAEVPFLVKNHPELWKTAERWSHYEYMQEIMKAEKRRNEHSLNNHMMYWKLRGVRQQKPDHWEPPTENVELTFQEWYKHAQQLEEHPSHNISQVEHFYFRLNGNPGTDTEFLFDELPFFQAKKNFFMVDPNDARGINCRFGSKGIIAELHYDFSRNFIMIFQGQKRYILAHPRECPHMELHPNGHPSARHSRINWSDPNDWNTGEFPMAQVNEVVMEAGDALYLPTAWFHFIVSLNLNYQCNARSGVTHDYTQEITKCGFPM